MLITLTWLRLDGLRRWRSLAVLALLIALATATVLTSIAGARRGESAWNRLWARTLPATVTVLPNQPGFDWARIAALPEVAALTRFPVAFGGEAQGYSVESSEFPLADDQMTRTIERPVILAGRLFNPHRADEVVVTPKFAATSGKHAGDSLTLELASVQQASEGYDGSSGAAPAGPRIRVRITGVIRSPWDVSSDTPGSPGGVITTPALFTRYRANIMGLSGQVYVNALVRLKGGEAAIPAFRAALARVTGRDDIDVWDNSVNFGDPIRRVTAYEAACLLAFGLAALVAALFLIGQSVARYTSATAADLQVLQSVGMTRQQAIAAAVAGPFLAGLAGATLGVAGAIVASRWMPIGLASIAEPHPGINVDWVVLGPGWVIVPLLTLAGSAAAAAAALSAGRRRAPQRRSAVAAGAAAANFPVPLVVGARFALEPGRGRSTVPVRSALVGAVVGVLGVLAAFTFSAGVSDAASHPARFGQTWQLTTFFGYNGQDFGPASRVLRAVAADRDVTGVDDARIGGAQSGQVSIESFTYAPVGGKRPAVVLTAGRMPASPDEIVLAPTTAQEMHATTGSVVRLTGGTPTRKAVRVTGIGFVPPGPHNGYADGAWLTPAGYDRIFKRRALRVQVPRRDRVAAGGRERPGRRTPARRGGGSDPGRQGLHLHATGSDPRGPGDPGPGTAAGRAERLPGPAGHQRRRLRPVHGGPPPASRAGGAPRARDHPAAGAAGGHDPGQPAGRDRPGVRHAARHRARPGHLAHGGRFHPPGVSPAAGPPGPAPDRPGCPPGRERAGRLAPAARRAPARRADPAQRMTARTASLP